MSNTLLVPGHRICEYKLIVPLSELLQETVMKVRASFYDKYKLLLPDFSRPSLTILNCHAYEGTEDKLAERIQQVATRTPSFAIVLENFRSCPSHTIYTPVSTKTSFYDLAKELRSVKSLTNVPGHEAELITEPSVLIAKDLKPFQFIRMWMDCEHQQFTGKCTATEMVLLKRSIATTKFDILHRFELACPSLHIKQGVLFA